MEMPAVVDTPPTGFAAVPLRSLLVEGCGIARLPPALLVIGKKAGPGAGPNALQRLHLAYNKIPDGAALDAALKSFPRLTDVTCAGNPACDAPGHSDWTVRNCQSADLVVARLCDPE